MPCSRCFGTALKHGARFPLTAVHAADFIPIDQQTILLGNGGAAGKNKYNSHNTERLNVEQIKDKLIKLDYVQRELAEW